MMTPELIAGLSLGAALGLRHALDADHLVAVTSMLSSGRRVRSALSVGLCWGFGHAVVLLVVGGFVVATGFRFPSPWQSATEAAVGVMILLLGIGVLRRHWRGSVHWHPHRHDGSRVAATGVGALHGLAGSAPLAIVLALTFSEPPQRYAALAASAVGSIAGMLLVTLCLAAPFLWSRAVDGVWHRRLEVSAGIVSVAYGIGFVVRALWMGS